MNSQGLQLQDFPPDAAIYLRNQSHQGLPLQRRKRHLVTTCTLQAAYS